MPDRLPFFAQAFLRKDGQSESHNLTSPEAGYLSPQEGCVQLRALPEEQSRIASSVFLSASLMVLRTADESETSGTMPVQVRFTSSRASLNEEENKDGMLASPGKDGSTLGRQPSQGISRKRLMTRGSRRPVLQLSWCEAGARPSAHCIFVK